ncbi:hypothetical protein [Aerococcus kribbianus]|uniref:DUF3168 domain-containing protein n=1 Tax=Aerococcus kribbianus TaxID=2999064 RepID=A0A9X3JDT3_9LACT|nr:MULTISPECIES: hypothetical protein [unclassified Aerococcus]MCZ0717831.1 hypothetical protein [Aerococcus sp. YH-aer221]MCZ0726118.1 hypothetical protein [Aerococcus sp. YH-aer222]
MVKDMKETIRNSFIADRELMLLIDKSHIKFYQWVEHTETQFPYIAIVPQGTPHPAVHGSNKELSKELTFDIHIQGKDDGVVRQISYRIHRILEAMGFVQLPESLDEYLEEIQSYVIVKRYRIVTKLNDTEY